MTELILNLKCEFSNPVQLSKSSQGSTVIFQLTLHNPNKTKKKQIVFNDYVDAKD